ncbi:TIGR02680 family protein [Georgenia yuyongxinii]
MTSLDGAGAAPLPHTVQPDGPLPRPTQQRWQPLRLGLVDLFYYDDEQFWFHDGRLLLRGNNGTGKSKVLALTLPFLLDGSIAPRRVEPDADPKKRMDWNLLLGGTHPSSERTGYSWVEFGRVDPDGTEHFTTLGIGLKAAAGRGIVKTWYFTSSRRIGDLRLLDGNRTVLSQERLRDELAPTGSGHVHTTQEAYRRAVDEALFRLGEERYAALIDLLIQLRQPQLSKRPDERALSAALTEALAPLDQAVIADVAESFRSLEDERAGIAEAKDTLRAAQDFLRHYRVYAKVASRRHTTAVREVNSAYEHAGRELREAQEQLNGATDEVDRLDQQRQGAEERQSGLRGQEQALRTSPEMRDAQALDQAEHEATETEARAADAQAEAERAAANARKEAEEADGAARRHAELAGQAQRREAIAARLAETAGLQAEHPTITGDADAAGRALNRRREQVRHVRRLIDAAQGTRSEADLEHRRLDEAQSDAAGRAEELATAREMVDGLVSDYRAAVREHVGGLTVLIPDGTPDELADLAEGWARSMSGEPPVPAALDVAVTTALARTGRERAEAEHTAGRLSEELTGARAQIADLEDGRDPEPPPASGRDHSAREGRAGAPLWWLTDFADALPHAQRAGLEAALQSAGLLDAWMFPDGTLTADGDVVLGPAGPEAAVSLAEVLVPATGPDGPVGAGTVTAVLRRIGWGETSDATWWVDGEGRWGAGPARGSWTKERAEFLGAGARESHRRELLLALHARAEGLDRELREARERVAAADRQAERVRDERAAYPVRLEREVGSAHERATTAEQELQRAQERVAATHASWVRAAEAATRAADELSDQAAQLGVGATVAETEEASSAVALYAEALVELRGAARALADAATAREQAAARAGEAAELRARRETEHRDVRSRAAAMRARYDALHATVGASVAELQARLGETSASLESVARELQAIAKAQLAAAATRGNLEARVGGLEERRAEAAVTREATIDALRVFAETGLLRVALPDLPVPAVADPDGWNLTAALGLSRAAEQRLHDVDESDEAWARAQQRVSGASTDWGRR